MVGLWCWVAQSAVETKLKEEYLGTPSDEFRAAFPKTRAII